MEELAMCRVCLSKDVRLRLIANTHLQELYESLTLLPLETKDSRPIGACYICCAGLQHCYRMRKKCLRSEELLTQMIRSNVLQPLNLQEDCTQRLRIEHPVIHLSIGDELQNNKDDDAVEDSAHRNYAPDVLNHGTVQQHYNEVLTDIIIKLEPQDDIDAQIDDDTQCLHIEKPLDVMKREPDVIQTDIVTETQEEQYAQIDDYNRRSHLDDPLEIIKEETDDVVTNNEDMKLEIEDAILEEKDPNVAGSGSHLADNIYPKIVKVELQRIDVKDRTTGDRATKKNEITALKNTEDATTNKRKIKVEKTEETENITIKESKIVSKNTMVEKPVTTSKILKTCEKFDIKLNKCENVVNNVCEEKSTSNTSLEHNVSSVSTSKNKRFSCDTCKKCFGYKGHLKTHILIHTGEKPYQCHLCKKCFADKTYLKNHILTHTGVKPHQCNFCKKSYFKKSHLNEHIRIHTGVKPHQCSFCKKCFFKKSHLNEHIRIHTGEKPYQCKVCKKSFVHKNGLKSHIRTHTGEKPYKCKVCKKCFSDCSNYCKHIHTVNLKLEKNIANDE